ncbi:MAG: PEP-CTERM sorting domain-containing protein [Gemmatimonadaceae bacterium]|nr:PEP-CTERM sorting domain-containing protein [Gemmatimonadaceae bacterium]
MSTQLLRAVRLGVAVVSVVAGAAVHAQTAITSITGGTTFPAWSTDETVGWQFRTGATGISVTSLGWWDQTPTTPLASSHRVGIWTLGGTLLGSVLVQTTSAITNGFRFENVTPFSLMANTDYLIGGRDLIDDGDSYLTSATAVTTGAGITLIGAARSADGSGFAAPTIVTAGVRGRFGPNFTYVTTTVIPEPSTYAMVATGLAVMITLGRRRRVKG